MPIYMAFNQGLHCLLLDKAIFIGDDVFILVASLRVQNIPFNNFLVKSRWSIIWQSFTCV